jgi:arabinofuranosyltransferase
VAASGNGSQVRAVTPLKASGVAYYAAAGALLCAYTVVVVRTAWISDDAMITLRTILNFTNGLGPVFNIGERVQGYTHPLWFLLLSAASFVITDLYQCVFVVSVGLAVGVYAALLFRIGTSRALTLLAAVALLLSKAFVDYSTSGLENPLAYCGLAVLLGVAHGE